MKDSKTLPLDLQAISASIRAAAQSCEGDPFALLGLLRMLENEHRAICDGAFQAALPTSRHELYNLLKDIEAQGGWPYIYSRHLKKLLSELVAAAITPQDTTAASEMSPEESHSLRELKEP